MRLKRLCEQKKSGKSWVSEDLQEDYKRGGESREVLELALLETLRALPTDAKHDKIRARVLATAGVLVRVCV